VGRYDKWLEEKRFPDWTRLDASMRLMKSAGGRSCRVVCLAIPEAAGLNLAIESRDWASLFYRLFHRMVSMGNTEHIYLTGFRGTGKTSVGTLLARSLGRTVVDLDGVVAANAGKSIREIFRDGGEVAFRELESSALEAVVEMENAVISLGGGAILRAANRLVIRSTGTCFWLDCDAETIAQRLQQDEVSAEQRPALTQLDELEEIRELLKARQSLYQETADHRIDTACKTIEQVTKQIIEHLQDERTREV